LQSLMTLLQVAVRRASILRGVIPVDLIDTEYLSH